MDSVAVAKIRKDSGSCPIQLLRHGLARSTNRSRKIDLQESRWQITRLRSRSGVASKPKHRAGSFEGKESDGKIDIMIDWKACPAVERSADTLSGAWRFKNTRVPVKALFENLESGATVDQFLEWFPSVTKQQALAVLETAAKD